MFPYKVRKPAWGSCAPNPKATNSSNRTGHRRRTKFDAASHLGGDPADSQTIGGNLQKAILLDLIKLRQRYFDLETSPTSSTFHEARTTTTTGASCASVSGDVSSHNKDTRPDQTTFSNHAAIGSSFSRFKACFREARFGAIHTRTIPPRVDRGEYIQLLYSSCLYLLEESGFLQDADLFLHDKSYSSSAFNAICAVFSLYTLHRTNVLPEAPAPRPHTKRTRSGTFDERSLKEVWSMLPIGINSDEDKMYRRTFRSGVRIDRWSYLLLLQLRDLCLARVDQCAVDQLENMSNWHCHCGLARDAVHVIEKMLFNGDNDDDNKFFQYCEYHGPVGLEGLAGCAHFYRTCVAKASKKSKRTKINHESPHHHATSILSELELSTIENENTNVNSFDLQTLSKMVESHCSNISSVMTEHQMSQTSSTNLQRKQSEIVGNTLRGVMEQSASYSTIVNILDVKNDVPNANHEAMQHSDPQIKDLNRGLVISFPESFPSALCDNIRNKLDFKEDAKAIRKAVSQAQLVDMKAKEGTSINVGDGECETCGDPSTGDQKQPELDYFGSSTAHENSQSERTPNGNAVLFATNNQHSKRKRQREEDTFLELHQEGRSKIENNDGSSALASLLSLGEDDNGDGTTNNTMENDDPGKTALLKLLSMAESNINDDVNNNQSTIATENGIKALRSLLSKARSNHNDNCLTSDVSMKEDLGQSDDVGIEMEKGALKFSLLRSQDQEVSTSKKCDAQKQHEKAMFSNHEDVHSTLSVQVTKSNAITEKQNKRTIHANDSEEKSVNVSAGVCTYDDFSVAISDAGKNALDLLLESAKNVELCDR